MGKSVTIALDVMGGDLAPDSVLQGAELFLKKHHDVQFMLFGDQQVINSKIAGLKQLSNASTITHTDIIVSPDDKASVALRKGRGSSMRLAIDSVRDGAADAVISAGNTGALMAMAKLSLRPLPGIDRPAITSLFPTLTGSVVLLDMGANIDCNSDNLVQFALMGDAYARVILGKLDPKVGLLNVGAEDTKGSEVVRSAAEELREGEYDINFCGYVEGNDIAAGTVDVYVTDGFTGNVALKSAEGTAKLCGGYVKEALHSSPLAMLGGLFARRSLKKSFAKIDPRYHNGGMFLGLSGIAVKSHGGADAVSFCNAIENAYKLAKNDINSKIKQALSLDDHEEDHVSAEIEELE